KQNYVADVRRTRQIHEESIDTNAHSSHGRHSVFHCAQIILVYPGCFHISRRFQPRLRLETTSLIERVIELAERVRHLFSICEKLEALGELRVAALRLRQW